MRNNRLEIYNDYKGQMEKGSRSRDGDGECRVGEHSTVGRREAGRPARMSQEEADGRSVKPGLTRRCLLSSAFPGGAPALLVLDPLRPQ